MISILLSIVIDPLPKTKLPIAALVYMIVVFLFLRGWASVGCP